jgi:hypothetical protein
MKELMGMNPLLINVYNLSWTNTGLLNFNNMSERFSTECISLHMNRKVSRAMMRKAFFKLGSPMWYWDRAVYVYPIKMAIALNIPLVVYGENIAYEYGGPSAKETYSAKDQLQNDVVKPVPIEEWLDEEITIQDMQYCIMPPLKVYEDSKVNPIYLSYFFPWDGFKNMSIASTLGFRTLEFKRLGYIEDYDQIDSLGYLVHPWLKYPKYGHSRTTDVASSLIRNGYMTRKHAVELVRLYDHQLDNKVLKDFLTFSAIPPEKFFDKVYSLYNRSIFFEEETEDGDKIWKLKHPIWEEKEDGERTERLQDKGQQAEPAAEMDDLRRDRGGTAESAGGDRSGESNTGQAGSEERESGVLL